MGPDEGAIDDGVVVDSPVLASNNQLRQSVDETVRVDNDKDNLYDVVNNFYQLLSPLTSNEQRIEVLKDVTKPDNRHSAFEKHIANLILATIGEEENLNAIDRDYVDAGVNGVMNTQSGVVDENNNVLTNGQVTRLIDKHGESAAIVLRGLAAVLSRAPYVSAASPFLVALATVSAVGFTMVHNRNVPAKIREAFYAPMEEKPERIAGVFREVAKATKETLLWRFSPAASIFGSWMFVKGFQYSMDKLSSVDNIRGISSYEEFINNAQRGLDQLYKTNARSIYNGIKGAVKGTLNDNATVIGFIVAGWFQDRLPVAAQQAISQLLYRGYAEDVKDAVLKPEPRQPEVGEVLTRRAIA